MAAPTITAVRPIATYGPPDWEAYCFSRYRSFDPYSGTYLGTTACAIPAASAAKQKARRDSRAFPYSNLRSAAQSSR